jgi:phospholipid/cholesterol/gamma-HCH transport system permease protein
MISKIGQLVIVLVSNLAGLCALIAAAFRDVPNPLKPGWRPVSQVFLKQLYFTGYESLKIIVIISLAIGTVIITQMIGLVGGGNEPLIGKVMVLVVIRELGPLLTAVIVIARSGAAIATELGTMKIHGEIDSIESLGISTGQYLVMPRVFGVTAAVIILTVYFEIFSIFGGFLVASLGWHVSFEKLSQGLLVSLAMADLSVSVIKSLFFGLLLSAACCCQGLDVGSSTTRIPQAATKGVMQSLFLVFITDGVITFAATIFRNA